MRFDYEKNYVEKTTLIEVIPPLWKEGKRTPDTSGLRIFLKIS